MCQRLWEGPKSGLETGKPEIRPKLQDSRRRLQIGRRFSQSGPAVFALIERRIAVEPGEGVGADPGPKGAIWKEQATHLRVAHLNYSTLSAVVLTSFRGKGADARA